MLDMQAAIEVLQQDKVGAQPEHDLEMFVHAVYFRGNAGIQTGK
jgi:hypothetical protein